MPFTSKAYFNQLRKAKTKTTETSVVINDMTSLDEMHDCTLEKVDSLALNLGRFHWLLRYVNISENVNKL